LQGFLPFMRVAMPRVTTSNASEKPVYWVILSAAGAESGRKPCIVLEDLTDINLRSTVRLHHRYWRFYVGIWTIGIDHSL
jgi:hypothetical protein